MKPTEEQQSILDCQGRVVKINARAGTGKTTTLQMLAQAHPDLKILYLVFNRRAREEASAAFPDHVEVRTVHSLAYADDWVRWKDQVGPFSIADLLPAFKGKKDVQQLATLNHDFLAFFMNSPFPRVEEAMEAFHGEHLTAVTEELKRLFERNQDRILQSSRDLLTAWYRQERSCPHDFYLKLFHRKGLFYEKLNSFDMILVDEAHDLSPIMLDALENCKRRIVIVGDTHQQIYSFRYAVDAMKHLGCDQTRELTLSFRFGSKIAEAASLLIRESKGHKGFTIRGNPGKSSHITFRSELPDPKPGERCAILSRTNLALFEKALALRSSGKAFSLEGHLHAILGKILDVHWLAKEQRDKIRDPFLQSFKNVETLETYAKELDDFQLGSMVKVVRDYAQVLPGAVFDMMKTSKATTEVPGGKGIILSTVHGAKGQEYDRVLMDRDIATSLTSPASEPDKPLGDEVNIAYVGMTRAIQSLYLPLDFRDILTPRWQQGLQKLAGARDSRSAFPREGLQKRSVPPFSSPRSPQRSGKGSAKKASGSGFNVGDRVITNQGAGTVVKAAEEKYLIHLDGQKSKVWRSFWALRKA